MTLSLKTQTFVSKNKFYTRQSHWYNGSLLVNTKGIVMKLAVCSDLHLEFGPLQLKNEKGAEVLILSGDVLVASSLKSFEKVNFDFPKSTDLQSKKIYEFFNQVCSEFKHVIYIAGNHEHYNGDVAKTHDILRSCLSPIYPNLHILENQTVTIGDVHFIGATLWTDMNKGDPLTMSDIKHMMNDFRIIKNSNNMIKSRNLDYEAMGITGNSYELPKSQKDWIYKEVSYPARFDPIDAAIMHKETLEIIDALTMDKVDEKFVVVGHHAPSKLSTHPRYKDEYTTNGGYSSDLSEFILDRPQIKVWTHGHTHEPFDYMVGSTRIICNPRGYDGYEARADEFELKYFEV